MITLISGNPGSGKTLYTVQEYIQKLIGQTITDPETGEIYPRTVYTNINGLTLEHELIDSNDETGLRGWHNWAKPGSVIVFDEVQKNDAWPRLPNGARLHESVEKLQTHRHMGVDFILLTQYPARVDAGVIDLVGQHIHIRRLGFSHACIVYEWDYVSRSLMYSKALNKRLWRFKKSTFKLYQSAKLHTKPKTRIPGIVWFLLIAAGGGAFLFPKVSAIFTKDRSADLTVESGQVTPAAAQVMPGVIASQPGTTYTDPEQVAAPDERIAFLPAVTDRPWTAPAFDAIRQVQDMPYPDGGMCMHGKCTCYRASYKLDMSSDACRQWMTDRPHNPYRAIVEQTNQPQPVQQAQQQPEETPANTIISLTLPGLESNLTRYQGDIKQGAGQSNGDAR